MKRLVFLAVPTLLSCGTQELRKPEAPRQKTEVEILKDQILGLQGTVNDINSLVLSDWATCETGGPDNLSSLQQNMCRIAQASTEEARLKLTAQLGMFVSETEQQLDTLSSTLDTIPTSADLDSIKVDLYGNSTGATCASPLPGSVCATLNDVESRVTTLETTVSDQATDISALETAVTNLNSQVSQVVSGAMTAVEIGSENILAGPLYETVLRNGARTRITAYIESSGGSADINNNGMSAVNGSSIVTVTTTAAHGFIVGSNVEIFEAKGFRGIPTANLNDKFAVLTVPSATTFTFDAGAVATSTGGGSGGDGYVKEILGRGLGLAWSATASTTELQTTFSSKDYHFVVTGTGTTFSAPPTAASLPSGWAGLTPGQGFICYSVSNRTASQAMILAGGSAVVCK